MQGLSLNERLTLFALFFQALIFAGQLVVFWRQQRPMRQQLSLAAEAEVRSQRHDRLTIRPYLEVLSYFDRRTMRVELSNEGLGLARISSLEVFIDDKLLTRDGGAGLSPVDALTKAFGFLPEHITGKVDVFHVSLDSALRPGGKVVLVHLELDGTYSYSHISRVRIVVAYQSLYDENFKLDWQVPMCGQNP